MKLIKTIIVFLAISAVLVLPVLAQEEAPGASPAMQKGNAGAEVTIEVFNDYQCPMCATFNGKLKAVEEKYPDTVLVTYRNYPLMQIHKHAFEAAAAVESAGRQGKVFEMMDLLYGRQAKWSNLDSTTRTFRTYAKKIGLDLDVFASDLESEDVKSRIELDIARGNSLKISGTPTVCLNGKIISLSEYPDLEEFIKKAVVK
jgi:protein-disulfide isomerase